LEEKLKELASLADQLDEAAKADETKPEDKEDKSDKEDATDTSDEPEGSKGEGEIVDDKEDAGDKGDEKKNPFEKNESAPAKIDLGALFEGQELTEDFKLKTIAVFEAAVEARVAQDVAELKESMDKEALTEASALYESLVEKVDGYLDYMVEQWMEKNALAVNRGIKTEILESFVGGMKDLFESHYIDVPDEKYDLIEATQAEVTELEAKLDEAVEENISLRASLKETARLIQIEEAVDGLAETDAEKFRELAESLSYTSEEEYAKKLQGIRESYFKKPAATEAKPLHEEFITSTPVEVVNEEVVKLDPVMARYVAAASK